MGPLAALTPVVGAVDPNYALQHDPRYSRVWPWYQQLRRRQEQEDRLWRWGQRTLAEGLQLALAAALDRLERERATTRIPRYTKSLVLRSEQEYGRFVDPRSQLGGWMFRRTNGLLGAAILAQDGVQAFEESFGTGTRVHELVPDAVVALYDPHRSDGEVRLLPIWLRLRGEEARTSDPAPEIAQGLSERGGRTTGAFILLDAQGAYFGAGKVFSESIRVQCSDPVLAHRAEAGIDLPSWIETLEPLLRQMIVGGGA